MRILLANCNLAHGAFHHWMTADLVALGHDVHFFDPDELTVQYGIELYRRVLVQRIAHLRPHVLIVYPPYELLRPADAARIRELGCAIAGFAYDDPLYLPAYHRRTALFREVLDEYRQVYDVYVTTARQMAREAAAQGHDWIKAIKWAINTPANPGNAKRDIPLVVIGAGYPRRVQMVHHLLRNNIRPVIFGDARWAEQPELKEFYKGTLSRPAMFDVYRRAQIALAPADWESSYSPMVKLRTLEIAGCGAFQIVEQAEDLADYYEPGKEIIAYRTWDDLVQLIQLYHPRSEQRQKIARAMYERTLRQHVWKVRWAELEAMLQPTIEKLAAKRSDRSTTPPDPNLCHEMSLVVNAMHFEREDLATSMEAYNQLEREDPNSFNMLLGKGRLLLHSERWAEAEAYLLRAEPIGRDLCGPGIDATVTQRRLGVRIGIGRVQPGIFPRAIEVWTHLLVLYARTNRPQDAEALTTRLSANQDELFVSIASLLTDSQLFPTVPPQYVARFVDVLMSLKPLVWLGEQTRHRAFFARMKGAAFVAMGQPRVGLQLLQQAMTMQPHPLLDKQLRQDIAQLSAQAAGQQGPASVPAGAFQVQPK